jgi:hypothetical protein
LVLSKQVLEETIGEAAKRVSAREEELNAVRIRLADAERELRLLAELAEMRGVELPDDARPAGAGADPVGNGSESRAMSRSPRSKASLLGAVVEILEAQGEPMQIRDLMAAVKERGVPIPGKGQQANLIAHISRDERIVRPRRGFYALREWGLAEARPKKRRTRRRPTGAS